MPLCLGASGNFGWCVLALLLLLFSYKKKIPSWKNLKYIITVYSLLSSLVGCAFKNTSVLNKNLLLQNSGGIFRFEREQLGITWESKGSQLARGQESQYYKEAVVFDRGLPEPSCLKIISQIN